MLTGHHLIAGQWVAGETTFLSSPATGEALAYSVGTPAHVNTAVQAAEAAFPSYVALPRATRAAFLDRIADEIEARGAEITAIGTAETGLPTARLEGERERVKVGHGEAVGGVISATASGPHRVGGAARDLV